MTHDFGERFFRHEFGRLVAMLARRVGMRHLALIEDAVQHALLVSVESWPRSGVPDSPSAWLFRVASNHLVGELRQRARRTRLVEERGLALQAVAAAAPEATLAGDVRDDLLKMLFACCDESIPLESQLAIALKTLCGFDVREIAERRVGTGVRPVKGGMSGSGTFSLGSQDRETSGSYNPGGFGNRLLAGFKPGDLGTAAVTWVIGLPERRVP